MPPTQSSHLQVAPMQIAEETITHANASRLLELGVAAIESGDALIDLSHVQRCDSSAVALLLAWRREAKTRAVALKFTGVPADLGSLASLYGVDELIA